MLGMWNYFHLLACSSYCGMYGDSFNICATDMYSLLLQIWGVGVCMCVGCRHAITNEDQKKAALWSHTPVNTMAVQSFSCFHEQTKIKKSSLHLCKGKVYKRSTNLQFRSWAWQLLAPEFSSGFWCALLPCHQYKSKMFSWNAKITF